METGRTTDALQNGLTTLVDNLLTIVSRVAPEAEPRETTTFQTRIAQHRRRIADATSAQELATEADACTKTCEQYFRRSRHYFVDREAEFTEMITILREAAGMMAGEASAFNNQVLSSSERFGALLQLDDIRVLKKQISTQVATLKRAVQEKQKRDEEAYGALTRRVEALQNRLLEAEEEASIDALTRVANRGSFDRTLRRMIAASRRASAPLSLALIDIDNFKVINDTHGHPVGDRVLLCAALSLIQALRKTDFVARYGGEEFAILLPDARVVHAEKRLTALIAKIAESNYEYEADGRKGTVQFTVSCGVTELEAGDEDDDLVRRADEALYEAKREGKNRVIARKHSLLGGLLA